MPCFGNTGIPCISLQYAVYCSIIYRYIIKKQRKRKQVENMDESTVILMQKNMESGLLEKELGCYTVDGNTALLFQIYAQEEESGMMVYLSLTCDREMEDWEYEAVFDYYDTEALSEWVTDLQEVEGFYNPMWKGVFVYQEETEQMEQHLTAILQAHEAELASVYEVIADKKDDYCEA